MAELELSLLADVRQFQKAVSGDVPMALEKVSDSLDEAARDGDRAGEKLERTFRELADSAKRESRKVGDSFQDNSQRGFSKAGDAVRNFKDEARQNFAEVASSFDGSVQGIADGIQGTLGGASIAIGGAAGVALGAMAIVGGAVGTAMATAIEEDAAASEERIQTMYESFLESGANFLTQQQRQEAISAITGDPEKFKEAKKLADDLGISLSTAILAQIEPGEARNAVLERALELQLEFAASSTTARGQVLPLYRDVTDQMKKLNDEQATAAEAADAYRSTVDVANESLFYQGKLIDDAGQKIAALPDKTVKLDIDYSDADRKLVDWTGKSRAVRIQLEGYTRTGVRVI